MKHILALLLLLPTLALAQKTPTGVTYDAQIVRVNDGDTVVISAPFLPAPLKPELAVRVFGVDTPEMAGASGIAMIEKLRDFVTAKGFVINNVALQIVGNQPKITPRRDEAQKVLTAALGAPVSVSATTSDQMGFTGRGEGIYVIASALVIAP